VEVPTLPDALDPTRLLETLDPDLIRGRLADLRQQERALRVLLRAVIARRRQPPEQRRQREVPHGH
jgi:hypothetical protein